MSVYEIVCFTNKRGASQELQRFLAIVASKRPQMSDLTSKLNSVTSITLISMCILPLKAIFMTSKAIAASK